MVHLFAALFFTLAAVAGAGVIWFTLSENRAAILSALRLSSPLPVAAFTAARHGHVRSDRAVTARSRPVVIRRVA